MSKLKSLFQSLQPDTVKVLVVLDVSEVGDELLVALAELGLQVDSVVGNKVIGSIEGHRLTELREHETVLEVEESVRLGKH